MRSRSFVRYVAIIMVLWIVVALFSFPSGSTAGSKKTAAPTKKATEEPHPHPPAPKVKLSTKKPESVDDNSDADTPAPHEEKAQHDNAKSGELPEGADARRQDVVDALKHSWNGYRKHAFGKDEFFPISKRTNNWGNGPGIGVTIIDALDTLMIAGLQEEVDECIEWIEKHLTFDQDTKVSVFETTIRVLGGLLSAYEQQPQHKVLLERAQDLGKRLLKTFETPSGIPDNYCNLRTGRHEGAGWNGGAAILSELGSLQLEFRKLAQLTKNTNFDRVATKAIKVIEHKDSDGMYARNFRNGNGAGGTAGLGSFGDSFYEYMLKVWLMSDKNDPMYKAMWDKAASHIIRTTSDAGGAKIPNGRETGNTMEHLACFSGGLFALSYLTTENEEHLKLAKDIAETCHAMYVTTPTGLAADVVHVRSKNSFQPSDAKYILRPETVETYFVLWRVTKDPKYRDWGHDVLKACNKYLKVDAGYAGTRDVYSKRPSYNDNMETFWFAETLKYLYLLFSEDSLLDLKEWVFNTEAHPVRVIPGWKAP